MGERPHLVYEYKGFTPGPAGWRVPREKLEEIDARGDLAWTRNDAPRRKWRPSEDQGIRISNCWDDIPPVNSQARERLGYPTQKPIALLDRILTVASREGQVVLDPFCGCGTTVHAAHRLGRQWIGIDVTHLAISLVERRLKDAFPDIQFQVHGTPKDLEGARALAAHDKYQFEWWAVSLVDAVPAGGKKKGADKGIDGFIYFRTGNRKRERAIVSVKGGENVGVSMIRDLKGVLDREKAPIGVFITLANPTRKMREEAAAAGRYEIDGFGAVPRIQILTVEELLEGAQPRIPLVDPSAGFKRAAREDNSRDQSSLI